jgi:hypothetical protein
MKVKIELELEIVITEVKEHKHNTRDIQLLESITEKTGTHIMNRYIDDVKINKTEIL